jgi:hypothetical protein
VVISSASQEDRLAAWKSSRAAQKSGGLAKAYAARNSSRSRLNVTRIASAGWDRIGR